MTPRPMSLQRSIDASSVVDLAVNRRSKSPGESNWMAQIGWIDYRNNIFPLDQPPKTAKIPYKPLYVEDGD